jgi:hypothetical protein
VAATPGSLQTPSRKSLKPEIFAMRMRFWIWLGLVAFSMAAAPVMAATSAPYAMGGRTKDFAQDVARFRQSGEPFRIVGHCQSACTMFLALPKVCIAPGAELLFHAGENAAATSRMFNAYNAKLKAYLTAQGAMQTPAFHTISGRDMIGRFGYRACGGK